MMGRDEFLPTNGASDLLAALVCKQPAGTDVAIEAAHVALMREDWNLIPDVLRIAQRTMRVVKMNLGFTTLYNVVGLSLAAFGFLPPVLAAAAQSLPG